MNQKLKKKNSSENVGSKRIVVVKPILKSIWVKKAVYNLEFTVLSQKPISRVPSRYFFER